MKNGDEEKFNINYLNGFLKTFLIPILFQDALQMYMNLQAPKRKL